MLSVFKDGEKVTLESLISKKIVSKSAKLVKLVNTGNLEKKLTISIPATKGAKEIIEKSGSKLEN
jgi:ribosomal protein L15